MNRKIRAWGTGIQEHKMHIDARHEVLDVRKENELLKYKDT